MTDVTPPPAPTYDRLITSHVFDSSSASWRLVLTTFEIPAPIEDEPRPDPRPVDEVDYIWDATDERWNGLTRDEILELQRADVAAAMKRQADEEAASLAAAEAAITEHVDAPMPLPSPDDPRVRAAIDAFKPPPPPPPRPPTTSGPVRSAWTQRPDGTPERQS